MEPLSVLPGRVRLQPKGLAGCRDGSQFLEERIRSVNGVKEVSASHRTGTVLVRFDEVLLSRGKLESEVKMALQEMAKPDRNPAGFVIGNSTSRAATSRAASSHHAGQLMIEMALHLFLPTPLDLLLPAAATVFRK